MKTIENLYSFVCLRTVEAVVVALLLVSCTDDSLTDDTYIRSQMVCFKVSETNHWNVQAQSRAAEAGDSISVCSKVFSLQGKELSDSLFLHATISDRITTVHAEQERVQTRSAPVETETFYDSFGVLTYAYQGTWDESKIPDYMYNVEVTKESSWTTSYHWPGNGRNVRFFAYAPYNGEGISLSPQTTAGTPSITYAVPVTTPKQNDLLVAASSEMSGNAHTAAPLNFSHALTAIRFVTGADMMPGKVTSIALKGVYGKATYTIGSSSWNDYSSINNFWLLDLSKEVDGTENAEITPPEATFMMLPQILPEGAQIEINYTDNMTRTPRTLTALIEGSEWPIGKTVTYRISTSSISLVPTFSVKAPEFTYEENRKNFSIISYISVAGSDDESTRVMSPWTAEFVEGDDETGYHVIAQPDWINYFTTTDFGSTAAKNYPVQLKPQQGIFSNPHDDILQSRSSVNTMYTPYNLSNATGHPDVRNTANCYVVNAPGKYSLPLVYGNGIKDGNDNYTAYSTGESGTYILETFVNHLGNEIESPYIYENTNCQPYDAVLLWQDEPDLLTQVTLSSDKHTLIFDVPKESIGQGNAVVAVRNSAQQIMWSWHIWITDYILGEDLKTVNYSGTHKMLPVNLGWCDIEMTTYAARSVKVRFTQTNTGLTQIVTLNQLPDTVSVGRNAPYYQWGRKDPILPSVGTSNRNKTWYDANGASSTNLQVASWGATGFETIVNGILNPHTFFVGNPSGGYYYNLWATDNTGTSAVLTTTAKTIYDPCPVGYKVPVINLFRAFTSTGENSSNLSQINGVWNAETKGWEFRCDGGGTTYFHAAGFRQSLNTINGGATSVREVGYYWAAVPYLIDSNSGKGSSLFFSNNDIHTLNNQEFSKGLSIRPVQEE